MKLSHPLRQVPGTVVAFIRKDFLEETSYRFSLFFELGGMLITLLFLAGISTFVGDAIADKLQGYQGNYLAFLVLGIGVYSLLDTALRDLSRRIRAAQTQGTLEALLATRTSLAALLLSFPAYTFLKTVLRLVGYLIAGALLFDLPLQLGNWPGAATILFLAVLTFGCFGIVFASLTLLFKRTEPVIAVFSSLCAFLGGVFYPTDILPAFVQHLAYLLPITPALEGLRVALLTEGNTSSVWPWALTLAVYATCLLPLCTLIFRAALRRALRDGTLGQY